ncbi:MAG: hypothetical protein JNM62_16005 [Flavobacteriales bacterium]|nr:hypothetical protein [Flavobacteriales bacterium]
MKTTAVLKLFLLLIIGSLLALIVIGRVMAIDQLVFFVVLSALVMVVIKGFVEGHRELQRGLNTERQ